ncbi:hypothetical protein LTR62_005905 [Meristemomyces frigidus]|uniref:DUF952 domain-containing protein n=1 Tax=Meristemomyces frigidus TaxID=1508187 RepID=A0AAN7THF4_9PEZI|nr:hypothetical protein LTR62_005905 [Meristemomyces frigidus]
MVVETIKPRFLYKILTAAPSIPISRTLTSLDASDGFMHLSTPEQIPATASRFFASSTTLWLVKLEREKLESGPGELKWEGSESKDVFPHLYDADLGADAVSEVKEVLREHGQMWEDVMGDLQRGSEKTAFTGWIEHTFPAPGKGVDTEDLL